MLFKGCAEISRTCEAKLFRNLIDGVGGILQHIHGSGHFQIDNILFGRRGEDLLKKAGEVGGGYGAHIRQLTYADIRLIIISVHKIDGSVQRIIGGEVFSSHHPLDCKIPENVVENHIGLVLVPDGLLGNLFPDGMEQRLEFFKQLQLVKLWNRKAFPFKNMKKDSLIGKGVGTALRGIEDVGRDIEKLSFFHRPFGLPYLTLIDALHDKKKGADL